MAFLEGEGRAGFSCPQDTGGRVDVLDPWSQGITSLDTGVSVQAWIQCIFLELEQWVPPDLQLPSSSRSQGLSLSQSTCASPWQCLWSARTPRQCQAHRALPLWAIAQLRPDAPWAAAGTEQPPLSGNQLNAKGVFWGCWTKREVSRVSMAIQWSLCNGNYCPRLWTIVGEGLLTLLLLLISRPACHQEKTGA